MAHHWENAGRTDVLQDWISTSQMNGRELMSKSMSDWDFDECEESFSFKKSQMIA